jgi:ferredoxin
MPHTFEVVAEDCIGCGLCSERAPENLEIPTGALTARVFKQPETATEEEACLEASDFCPMGGLHAGPVESAPADSSPGGAYPPLVPAGDSTPACINPTKLEI